MVRLKDLNAYFLTASERNSFRPCDSIRDADGIVFTCPLCFLANGGSSIGVHSVICWSPTVSQERVPGPGRWSISGTSIDDVTLSASSPSVQLHGGCAWHGYVRDGACVEGLGPDRVEATRQMWQSQSRPGVIMTTPQDTTAPAVVSDQEQSAKDSEASTVTEKSPQLHDTVPSNFHPTHRLGFIGGVLAQQHIDTNVPAEEPRWLKIGGTSIPPGLMYAVEQLVEQRIEQRLQAFFNRHSGQAPAAQQLYQPPASVQGSLSSAQGMSGAPSANEQGISQHPGAGATTAIS